MRLRLAAATVLLGLFLSPSVTRAQINNVNDTTSTPIPGVGHDYIQLLNETVNPADGSVNLTIQAPIPKGRGLDLPLAFAYSSNGVNVLNASLPWAPKWNFGTYDNPVSLGWGWAFTLPQLTVNYAIHQETGGNAYQGYYTLNCYYNDGFVFQDAANVRRNLYVYAVQTQVYAGNQGEVPCGSSSKLNYSVDGINATLVSTEAPIWGVPQIDPPELAAEITDPDGNLYSFDYLEPQGPMGPGTLLPNTIEDRNGNIVAITTNGGTVTAADTLGRTVFSYNSSANGGTVTFAAGMSYTVTDTSSTANFTVPATLQTAPPSGVYCDWPSTLNSTGEVVHSIELPNNQQYTFYYGDDNPNGFSNPYGLLSEVDYPSGMWIRYRWSFPSQMQDVAIDDGWTSGDQDYPQICPYQYSVPAVQEREVGFAGSSNPVLTQTFAYTTAWTSSPYYGPGTAWTTKTTTVTTTDDVRGTSFNTVYTYQPFYDYPSELTWSAGPAPNLIPLESQIQYYGVNGSLLRTENKTWNDPYQLVTDQITLNDVTPNIASQTVNTYSSNPSTAQLTQKAEYDFGQTTPTRTTVLNYQTFNSTPVTVTLPYLPATPIALTPGIVDKPCQEIVYAGTTSGTRMSETDTFYDNAPTTTVCGTAGTPSVQAVTSLSTVTHDATCYLTTPISSCGVRAVSRGNATAVIKQCFQSGAACANGNSETTYTYDVAGQVASMTDPCGNASCSDMPGVTNHTTTYSYSDVYNNPSACGGTAPPVAVSDAYLTTVTYPPTGAGNVSHIENFCYGYDDGQLRASTDQNSQPTTYVYSDPLRRITSINYPGGGQTSYSYNDTPPNPTVTTTKLATPDPAVTAIATMDGMGHTIQTELTTDPVGPVYTNTAFDGLGHVYTVSNPFRSTNDPTYGITTYTYDSLGRTTLVAEPGTGATIQTAYLGRATSVSDEGNGTQSVQKISQVDGLGRLTSLCEVTSASLTVGISGSTAPAACGQDVAATGFLTTYTYDVLDNLLSTAQGPLNPRTFAYDSFSRLSSSTNPESATTNYTYDLNSNVTTKQDARSDTITYTYDGLNRLTGKSYSDSTPAATFTYDQTSALGITLSNTRGRMSSESTGGSSPTASVFSYDPMGRVWNNSQCTPQNCSGTPFSLAYTYDVLGNTLTSTNGANVTFTGTYNGSAQLTTLLSSLSNPPNEPSNLLSSALYTAPGALSSAYLGNSGTGVAETRNYDDRMRLTAITDGADYMLTIPANGYAPNSDIVAANDSVNGNWAYSYDAFNRLIGSNQNNGQTVYTYCYDRFGNRWTQTTTSNCSPASLGFDANNHINSGASVTYDAAGNVTSDGTHAYTYDAEDRLTQVDAGSTAAYVYDADGRRVRKTTTAGGTVDFVYDLSGQEIGQFSTSAAWMRGEVYAAGQHLATYTSNTTYFIYADWLGTERARGTATGSLTETCTSLPFGDALNCTGSDVSPMHFTGKERDTESGLDNFSARYGSSNFGRFMSPDPLLPMSTSESTSADFQNFVGQPQNWNRYAYVLNDPLINTDPTGLECVWDDGSYDAEDDPDTGSVGQCQGAGGTWIELGQNGGWSPTGNNSLNQNGQLEQLVSDIHNGLINAVSVAGLDGTPNVTRYDSQGRVDLTATSGAVTYYGYYGNQVTPIGSSSVADPGGAMAAGLTQRIKMNPGLPLNPDDRRLLQVLTGINFSFSHPLGKTLNSSACNGASISLVLAGWELGGLDGAAGKIAFAVGNIGGTVASLSCSDEQ